MFPSPARHSEQTQCIKSTPTPRHVREARITAGPPVFFKASHPFSPSGVPTEALSPQIAV